MKKLKVALSAIWYPLCMGTYFWRALERRDDIDLIVVGPFTGDYIPWNGGIHLPARYVKTPTVSLSPQAIQIGKIPYPMLKVFHELDDVDLWLEIDAGFYIDPRPEIGIVAHVATDPHCVSANTMLATNKGILFAEEAANSCVNEVADKKSMQKVGGVIFSGWKNLLTLKLENGYEITCTDDHKIEISTGFMPAGNFKVGDKVLLSAGTYSPVDGQSYEYSIGFVIGAFQGDGSFSSSDIIKFITGTESKKELRESLKFHLSNGFEIETVTSGKHYTNENTTVLQVRRYGLFRFLKSLNLKEGHIPYFVRTGSKSLIGGYVAGLLATDGCSVNGLLQITTKWENLAKELQILLLYLGVIASRKQIITGKSSYKPGQKYQTLHIRAGESCKNLFALTGHIPGKAINVNSRKRGLSHGKIQEFKVLEIVGQVKNYSHLRVKEPVYDVINSDTFSFLANGISVHNCLNYDRQRQLADFFFCMQTPYMKAEAGDFYLPYAFDPTVHFPEPDTEKTHDACIIGLQYAQRNLLVNVLRASGYNVHQSIGEVFDEYRHIYNQSRVALSWSSLNDLPARVWEAFGMSVPLVTNRVPDLSTFFVEGEHYLGFSNVAEGVNQVKLFLNDPDMAHNIAENAYRKAIAGHTWDHRIQQILETVRLK